MPDNAIESAFDAVEFEFEAAEWHTIAVEAVGSSLIGFFDGVAMVSYQNPYFASGAAALFTCPSEYGTVYFDDVTVSVP